MKNIYSLPLLLFAGSAEQDSSTIPTAITDNEVLFMAIALLLMISIAIIVYFFWIDRKINKVETSESYHYQKHCYDQSK